MGRKEKWSGRDGTWWNSGEVNVMRAKVNRRLRLRYKEGNAEQGTRRESNR